MRCLLCAVPLTLIAATMDAAEQADPGAPAEAIAQWRDLRFGMFIHWGPVALTGHEIGWSRGRETPSDEYDALYKGFNPVQFDANAWAATAKAAGMKYVVITTKHHDGFCLWPSDYTEYDIASTPFGRDVLKELSEACRKQGLEFGTYYSVCDWRHPDFPRGSPGGKTEKPSHNLDRYMQFLQNQTLELIENYGPLLTMWFDVPQEVHRERGLPVTLAARKLQPDIVINNRGYREPSGDFDTPEQRIGGFNRDRPWETCMTICRQWAWKPGDEMKSLAQCVQTLLYTVGGDGNLLFNVGPMPDGRIEPRQVKRLREMGDWIRPRADAIYGTRGGPIKPGPWGASTCRANHVYLFVMNWPEEGPLTLPSLGARITDARLLNDVQPTYHVADEGFTIYVPADQRDPIATVIRLTVDGAALDIPPVASATSTSKSLAYGKRAAASNVFHENVSMYGPAMAVDDDLDTRWATESGTQQASLEVDLGKPMKVGRVKIVEPDQYQRVKNFQLAYRDGDQWKTLHTGAAIGPDFTATFAPITAQRLRLRILQADDGPTISELQVFSTTED